LQTVGFRFVERTAKVVRREHRDAPYRIFAGVLVRDEEGSVQLHVLRDIGSGLSSFARMDIIFKGRHL